MTSIVPDSNIPQEITEKPEENKAIVSDGMLLGVYEEIMGNLRNDRKEIDDVLSKFVDMVINEGDSTSSSKEALVNLIKLKTESADKMAKVADLMTRVVLKEKDTFKPYMAKSNTINIIDQGPVNKRAFLRALEKAKKTPNKENKDKDESHS